MWVRVSGCAFQMFYPHNAAAAQPNCCRCIHACKTNTHTNTHQACLKNKTKQKQVQTWVCFPVNGIWKATMRVEANQLKRHRSPINRISADSRWHCWVQPVHLSASQGYFTCTLTKPARISGVEWSVDEVCSPPLSVCLLSVSAEHDHMCLLSRASSPAGQRPAFAVKQGRWVELHGFLDETLQHPSVKHAALPALRSPSLSLLVVLGGNRVCVGLVGIISHRRCRWKEIDVNLPSRDGERC